MLDSLISLIRRHPRFFLFATLAAIALRIVFVLHAGEARGDTLVYGDIAKNWIERGIYGLTDGNDVLPTFIRLPGYPAFLALVFRIFGMDNYGAALWIQLAADLLTCFFIADIARRIISARAALAAFLLAAICPMVATYVGSALTETLEIFFTAAALDLAVKAYQKRDSFSWEWIACGLATSGAMLLRPDGGLILAAIGIYLAYCFLRDWRPDRRQAIRWMAAACLFAVSTMVPLVPWAWRNYRTFHRFEPLAPRYADDPGEWVPMGFNRWVKTWIADYVSTEEIYWRVPGEIIQIDDLPSRAFDSPEERRETEAFFEEYNRFTAIDHDLDQKFELLAKQRIHDAPLRYYVWLPALRSADMWLRPRTEAVSSNTRWWEFDDEPRGLILMVALGLINLAYIAGALVGLFRGSMLPPMGALLLFVLMRTVFLGSLENPESRYTLECYPVIIALAADAIQRLRYFSDLRSA